MAKIHTVRGPIEPEELGYTLPHEHVMCDFIGAEETDPQRWQGDEVVRVMLPYLQALADRGYGGFVDCTPNYLGRDVSVLRRLSQLTGLHILTNTGLYKEPYLPQEVFDMTPQQVAEMWVAEWREGIDGTDVRPGFVKIAVNPGELVPIQQVIVRAAAITHLLTGLTVACHTGHPVAARESLDLVADEGMDPAHWIIVHAQNIEELDRHVALAERGAWLEYDAIGGDKTDWHRTLLLEMLDRGYEDQLLLSHDAGWYSVGEPEGGSVRPFTTLHDRFIPELKREGVDHATVSKLTVENPRRAFTVS